MTKKATLCEKFACPAFGIFFGSLLISTAIGINSTIDGIQASLVDTSYIEGNDVIEEGCSAEGIVTCEQTQAEKYLAGHSGTKGTKHDIYLYSVQNPGDVLTGAKPRLHTVGPFQAARQNGPKDVSSFTDGVAKFKMDTMYALKTVDSEVLEQEVVVPNMHYTALIAAGKENVYLSKLAGQYYEKFTKADLIANVLTVSAAAVLTADEATLVWDDLLSTTDDSTIIAALAEITSVWDAQKKEALLSHIAKVGQETAALKYGPGAPLFMTMTAAQALNWNGSVFEDPLAKVDIGFGCMKTKPAAGENVVQVGSSFKDLGAYFITQADGVKIRCNVDPDCQDAAYKTAFAATGAIDVCQPTDTCTPMKVEGFEVASRLPANLFHSEHGNEWDDYGEGTRVTMWEPQVGPMTLTNSGVKIWDGVHIHRWIVSEIHDRRENCDGDAAQGSKGIDCESPIGAFSAASWSEGESPPPLYYSLSAFQTPPKATYKSSGKYETRLGSVREIELPQTKLMTVGPYKAADGVIFLSPPGIDSTMYFDTEVNTGNVIRFNQPIQKSVRVKDSVLVAGGIDVLIPMYVANEWTKFGAGGLKAMRGLQNAGLAEIGLLPWMKSIGSGFIIYFIFVGLARAIWGMPKPVYAAEAEQEDGSLLVGGS